MFAFALCERFHTFGDFHSQFFCLCLFKRKRGLGCRVFAFALCERFHTFGDFHSQFFCLCLFKRKHRFCFIMRRFTFLESFCCLDSLFCKDFCLGLFLHKCFSKRIILFGKSDILCGQFDIFLLFNIAKCRQRNNLFIQFLDFIIQLRIFIFKIFSGFFQLVHLILQLIHFFTFFENFFLQQIRFFKPFCLFRLQSRRFFLFGNKRCFHIFVFCLNFGKMLCQVRTFLHFLIERSLRFCKLFFQRFYCICQRRIDSYDGYRIFLFHLIEKFQILKIFLTGFGCCLRFLKHSLRFRKIILHVCQRIFQFNNFCLQIFYLCLLASKAFFRGRKLFFKLSNLLIERFRFCIPNLGSLFLCCNDFLGRGNDQIHCFELHLERIIFRRKRFVIPDFGGNRLFGIGKRVFKRCHF